MATVACAGCGLPRTEAEAGTPCPVCDAGGMDRPMALPRVERDPFALPGYPSDASQLAATEAKPAQGHRPEIVMAVLGAFVGAALVLGVQSLIATEPESKVDTVSPVPTVLAVSPVSPALPLAPTTTESPKLAPRPRLVLAPPATPVPPASPPPTDPPEVVLEVNQPEATLTFPTSALVKEGHRVVVRGEARGLLLFPIKGMHFDASGLNVEKISVVGRVGKGTVLKLNAPKGLVQFSGSTVIENGGRVSVNAPEGTVDFKSSHNRIASGATVDIMARTVEFAGAIEGDTTRVRVTVANGGSIKASALRGTAALEYRKSHEADVPVRIDIPKGNIDRNAVLRRVD